MTRRHALIPSVLAALVFVASLQVGATRATWSDFIVFSESATAGVWPTPFVAFLPAACPALDGGADTDPSDGQAWGYSIVVGTEGPDNLQGDAVNGNKSDLIFALGGDDVIQGGNQNDCLVGGAGNDTIGGDGPDENGQDVLVGGPGDDLLDGGNSKDVLHGGDGNDTLNGSNGGDDLYGGAGDDVLIGSNGSDVLDGGDGLGDACEGGRAPDVYFFCETIDGLAAFMTVLAPETLDECVPSEAAPCPEEPVCVPSEAAPCPEEPVCVPSEEAPCPEEPVCVPSEAAPCPEEPVCVPSEEAPCPEEPGCVPTEEVPCPEDTGGESCPEGGDCPDLAVETMEEEPVTEELEGEDGSGCPDGSDPGCVAETDPPSCEAGEELLDPACEEATP